MRMTQALAAIGALLPVLCLGQKVNTDFDHSADFTKCHAYRWVAIAKNPAVNQLAEQRIQPPSMRNSRRRDYKK